MHEEQAARHARTAEKNDVHVTRVVRPRSDDRVENAVKMGGSSRDPATTDVYGATATFAPSTSSALASFTTRSVPSRPLAIWIVAPVSRSIVTGTRCTVSSAAIV